MADKKTLGLCRSCEFLAIEGGDYDPEASDWICPHCESSVTPHARLTPAEKAVVRMWLWLREVRSAGRGGPSPGGAASKLGCSRSMIDKLVNMGVLERDEYDADGHYIVMISDRSIRRALEAKRDHGKWTDG
jgi:hypothetical protein